MSDFEIRQTVGADFEAVRDLFAGAMMFDPTPDELRRQLFEPERT